jgi:spore coat polysaccharide biosynthesis protein SpsF (cytidylyltransferase family)
MKIVEFMGGVQLPITNEEADVLAKFDELDSTVLKTALTEREQVLANQLVNKGVLVRKNQDGYIQYRRQVHH